MTTTDTGKIRYFQNLDALRGVAALGVVLFHVSTWFPYPKTDFWLKFRGLIAFNGQSGQLGVHFFFVLSGFLITYLMMLERQDRGRLDVPSFYVRRALRIWPLYFATLFVGLVIYPWIQTHWLAQNPGDLSNWYRYVLFLANFDFLSPPGPPNGLVGVHWSVAIEEQFYLIWPLLFVLTPRKWFPALCATLVMIAFIFFQLNVGNRMIVYFHTLPNVSSLASGALLAWIAFEKPEVLRGILDRIPVWVRAGAMLFFLAILWMKGRLVDDMGMPKIIYEFAAVIFFLLLLADQTFSTRPVFAAGRIRILDWLGKISYGLYLLHVIALKVVYEYFQAYPAHILIQAACGFALAIGISVLSYRYFEQPFNRMRKRFSKLSGPGR